jgi:pimeloyl-ACP methyl ester carboxylesterase
LFLNDLRIHYLHWNLAEGNPLLVLMHGLASNARIWELVAEALAGPGFAVLAPDARGHGLTDKPDGDYGMDTITRDLAALVNAYELVHPILVGHSWGGSIALDYAARFTSGSRAPGGIALVDGGATQLDAAGLGWEEMRDRLTPPRLAGMPLGEFLERLSSHNPRWQPDARAAQIILANFEVSEDETIYPRLSFEHHMQIVRAMWEFKTYERFTRLRCPVMIVSARPPEPLSQPELDYMASKEAGIAIARERIQRLQVHWMEDTIHDIPLQRPAELASLLAGFVASAKRVG